MIEILGITSPIFLIVFLGYVLTRRGLFSKPDIRVLGTFVVNLALPALVFKALATSRLDDILNPTYLFAYAFGSLVALAAGYASGRAVTGKKPLASTFYAMGASCANTGFVGYPILLLTLPAVAGVTLALNIVVENLLIIPLILILAERSKSGAGGWETLRKLLKKLACNPLILAMIGGMLASACELALPTTLLRCTDMLAAASGALSLFVIGGALVGQAIGATGKAVVPIIVGKLFLHPLGVFAGLLLAGAMGMAPLEPSLQMAAILMAAMPMMGIYATLALQYGQEDFAAVAQLLTTIVSFFTLSGLLWLLRLLFA